MDYYNSKLAKLFRPIGYKGNWAVTLGQTTYYTCPESMVTDRWRKHEMCHQRQWARDGKVKFTLSYIWQGIWKGYRDISYEIEAREAELM
jgi:hypothetical protein